jgi:ornithine cyclodeaminase
MIYLNESGIKKIGINWQQAVAVIEQAVMCLSDNDFSQPIKPYLRYRDLTNRIIAMPAFVGGSINSAGIKWIASFPGNIKKGIPRAHSVVILNDVDTGEPVGIINTALLSIIRTAAVSGLMIQYFDQVRNPGKINLGITGWGPIGQYHFKMATNLLKDKISKVFLYDIRGIQPLSIDHPDSDRVVVTDHWQQAFRDADIFITCTVSKAPYIDQPPKKGSLQLNVSLRDYMPGIFDYVGNSIIVDDWEEVCREKTDIEMIHKEKGLQKEDTRSIADVVVHHCMKEYDPGDTIMFNPMGMAVFDIALGRYYIDEALKKNIGVTL